MQISSGVRNMWLSHRSDPWFFGPPCIIRQHRVHSIDAAYNYTDAVRSVVLMSPCEYVCALRERLNRSRCRLGSKNHELHGGIHWRHLANTTE